MEIREFRQAGRLHTLIWRIGVEGAEVHVWHGVLDGRLQHTFDTKRGRNVGRSNEKLPHAVALEEAERAALDKLRSGYTEYVDGEPVRSIVTEVDLAALPAGLTFYKPANSCSKHLLTLLEKELAWALRKRNGYMMVLARDMGRMVTMYSRKMLGHMDKEPGVPWTERFPQIAEEFSFFSNAGTVLLGELVASAEQDDFRRTGSLLKSYTPRALELQEKHGWAAFYVWDVAFYEGRDILSSWAFRDRLDLAHQLTAQTDFVLPPEIFVPGDYEREEGVSAAASLKDMALQLDWEGWVIVDPEGKLGDRAWNLRGKAERSSKVSGKLKPVFEDDFVAYWNPANGIGEYGSGRHQGLVKSLALFQYDSRGKMAEIGKVASGLTDALKKQLADPAIYPIVVQVEYAERYYKAQGDGSNALFHPRFVQIRDDKDPKECADELLG
jgi:hypothetical protein